VSYDTCDVCGKGVAIKINGLGKSVCVSCAFGGRPDLENSKQKRNDPCLCGSGKKYKKCCIQKER
jgi:hypothetical protein